MSTHPVSPTTDVTTVNPARADVPTGTEDLAPADRHHRPRGWAVAGLAATIAGVVSTTASGMVDAIYDRSLQGDTAAIAARLADQTVPILVFHVSTVVCAVLMVVFAAGLLRRMRQGLAADHLAPMVAAAGLVGTAVVLVLGSGLDTEFVFGVQEQALIDPANAALFNHWIGTVPWCYVLVGLTGLALHSASRAGGMPRWMGRVGLVLGGLTLLVGIAPVQYMASMTAQLMLLILTIGLLAGDRAHRRS